MMSSRGTPFDVVISTDKSDTPLTTSQLHGRCTLISKRHDRLQLVVRCSSFSVYRTIQYQANTAMASLLPAHNGLLPYWLLLVGLHSQLAS